MIKASIPQVNRLSVSEKLLLMEELWEDLAAHPDEIPLSDAQRRELDERYEDYKKNPDAGVPWAEVKKQLLKGL